MSNNNSLLIYSYPVLTFSPPIHSWCPMLKIARIYVFVCLMLTSLIEIELTPPPH